MSQSALPTMPRLDLSPEDALDLFPDPAPSSLSPATPATPPNPTAPQVPPQPTPNIDDFIKGDISVYKTREAAVQGINEKDALIRELRQRYSLATGIDPISKQPVAQTAQGSDYSSNPESYVDALKKADTPEKLTAVQRKFVMDTLAPAAATLGQMARSEATRKLEQELPDFNNFYGSTAYRQTLDQLPSLREAIETAEGDVRFSARLTELYKLAYLADRGVKLPELLKQRPSQNQTPQALTTPSSTPPLPDPSQSEPATLNTSKGRKAIIEEYERRLGNRTLPWA